MSFSTRYDVVIVDEGNDGAQVAILTGRLVNNVDPVVKAVIDVTSAAIGYSVLSCAAGG